MPTACEYVRGCEKPGLYVIPTAEVTPLSIRVCAEHRALWVMSLRRRNRWPCAIDGCPRQAAQDGLCEHCWTVVRAHDLLLEGEVEPLLRMLAVRHIGRPIVAETPEPQDVEAAAKMVDPIKTLVRTAAALTGRAPLELRDDLEEVTRLLTDLSRHTTLLAQVALVQPEIKQGRLF